MIKKHTNYKQHVLQNYLQFQFNLCTKFVIPWKHLFFLTLATLVIGSLRYILMYTVAVCFVVGCVVLAEYFPNKFGTWYIAFLKKHCDTEDFIMYCGDSFSIIKISLKINSNLVNTVLRNGGFWLMVVLIIVLGVEHMVYYSQVMFKLKKLMHYKLEESSNNGIHPSGAPFLFVPKPILGSSLVERLIELLFNLFKKS